MDGIPAGVELALNVTATGATANTYVTAWPDGTTRPGTSTLNPPRGVTVANFAIVRVGANGNIDFYNSAGTVHLLADIAGYVNLGP